MTNIVTHPALRTNPDRIIRSCRAELVTQRDRAVSALDQAVSALTALDSDDRHADVASIIGGLQAAMEVLSNIDPSAPPDPALLTRLADAVDRLSRFAVGAGKADRLAR